MAGFIEGADRGQLSLLPGSLDDWVGNDNPVRVIDAFVDKLDLNKLGFETVEALDLGRPGRRVSDESVIPLCRTHHREVHRVGDELTWWKQAGIDPLKVARGLWERTRPYQHETPTGSQDPVSEAGLQTSV